ncbi:hypothetical protein [Pseudomonas sp. 8 R 14]|nr:hypothetical protein [Pseudomonas sp. 8 R 14]SAM35148.1 hypothetical protein BN1864_LIB5394:05195 [Pseudomonas sp. 1 R 17]
MCKWLEADSLVLLKDMTLKVKNCSEVIIQILVQTLKMEAYCRLVRAVYH